MPPTLSPVFRTAPALARFLVCTLVATATTAGCPMAGRAEAPKPSVSGVHFQSITKVDQLQPGVPIEFRIEIVGEHFGNSPSAVTVHLIPAVGAPPTDVNVLLVTDTSIIITAKAPVDTVINPILLDVAGTSLVIRDTLTLKPTPEDIKIDEFEFKMALNHDDLYKNLYSVVLTTTSDSFSEKLLENGIDLVPAGYTNLQIEPTSNTRQLVVNFLAPEGFDVKNAVATVYKGTDLESRKVLRVGKMVKEFKANPDQPKIDSTSLLALQRSEGIGRLKIEGSGFGKYSPPPASADEIFRA